jgi:glucose-1-phosphate cytidylyltransferase
LILYGIKLKVIILAGGFGTRMAEYTDTIPKPMVAVGGKPILWHIMRTYSHFGHKDFYVALGYKAEVIKEYFLNYRSLNSDFTVDLSSGEVTPHQLDPLDWRITLVNTGDNSMTGGRVRRMREYIGNETCMMTYGDGLANIDLDELLKFHRTHGKMVTVSAVRHAARFGELELNESKVINFKEKPQLHEGWINGGYFVLDKKVTNYISGDEMPFEWDPLTKLTQERVLGAFFHEGFWAPVDTLREKKELEKFWNDSNPPWVMK